MIEEMCPLPTPPAQYAPSMHPSGQALPGQPPLQPAWTSHVADSGQHQPLQPPPQQFPGGHLQLPGAQPPNAPPGGAEVAAQQAVGEQATGLAVQSPPQLQMPGGPPAALQLPGGPQPQIPPLHVSQPPVAAGATAATAPPPAAMNVLPIFLCPLSGGVMRDPVVDLEGNRCFHSSPSTPARPPHFSSALPPVPNDCPCTLSYAHTLLLAHFVLFHRHRSLHSSYFSLSPCSPCGSYERQAIEAYLARGNSMSPITGRPLRSADLVSNGYRSRPALGICSAPGLRVWCAGRCGG